MHKVIILHIFILILAVFVCYANTFDAPFLWDDETLIVRNKAITDVRAIPRLFQPHRWPTDFSGSFYRPLQMVSYTLDYLCWHHTAAGYHLTNVMIHVVNVLLLYWLLSLISASSLGALVGSMLFAVHPLHTQAVSYVAGRADLLVLFFILCFFITYTKMVKTVGAQRLPVRQAGAVPLQLCLRMFVLILFFLGALFSKEIALSLPLVIILWHICLFGRKQIVAMAMAVGSTGIITVLYILWRVYAIQIDAFDIYAFSLGEQLMLAVKTFSLYSLLVVFPLTLHMEYMIFPAPHLGAHDFIIPAVWLLCFIGGCLYALKREKRVALGLLWFMVLLVPVLNLIPLNATFAEHWVYVPFIGLALVASRATAVLKQRVPSRRMVGVFIVVVLLLSGRTIMRNLDWRDPIRFYEQTLRHSPNNIKVMYNLGTVYLRRDEADQALAQYDTILRTIEEKVLLTRGAGANALLTRLLAKTYNNMGNAYVRKEEYRTAEVYFIRSITILPTHEASRLNLALLYEQQGQRDKAQEQYAEVLRINPQNEQARRKVQ